MSGEFPFEPVLVRPTSLPPPPPLGELFPLFRGPPSFPPANPPGFNSSPWEVTITSSCRGPPPPSPPGPNMPPEGEAIISNMCCIKLLCGCLPVIRLWRGPPGVGNTTPPTSGPPPMMYPGLPTLPPPISIGARREMPPPPPMKGLNGSPPPAPPCTTTGALVLRARFCISCSASRPSGRSSGPLASSSCISRYSTVFGISFRHCGQLLFTRIQLKRQSKW
mmetsp:Transcript_3126/g.7271  ORF Transcript_3126/g.7271 Transcript_3126/m.7271 type:complete len:221 (+) Transcript_3126:629-1291(+)